MFLAAVYFTNKSMLSLDLISKCYLKRSLQAQFLSAGVEMKKGFYLGLTVIIFSFYRPLPSKMTAVLVDVAI